MTLKSKLSALAFAALATALLARAQSRFRPNPGTAAPVVAPANGSSSAIRTRRKAPKKPGPSATIEVKLVELGEHQIVAVGR